ncbi:MAG: late competence protein ComER [Bacilli bacterium]
MTYTGFIGTGNMGSILIEAFITSGALEEGNVHITNRTLSKCETLQQKFPEIKVHETYDSLIKSCRTIFLCMKPLDMLGFLKENGEKFRKTQLVISITSPLSVLDLQRFTDASVARCIPSITNSVYAGCTLLTFGDSMTQLEKQWLTLCCESIGTPIEVQDEFVRISSDIVSCGPAFISWVLQDMINSANSFNNLDKETATTLVSQMMIGFGELIASGKFSLETLQQKVCVKGGITGEGILALEQQCTEMFASVYTRTHKKFNHEVEIIKNTLSN